MKITKIKRAFTQVKQLTQYNPITVYSEYEAELTVKDKPEEVSKKLYGMAVEDVNKAMNKIFNPEKTVKLEKTEEDNVPDWYFPKILTHPNIPKPLHGQNPRTIKGQKWWDTTRKEVYETTNDHCVACRVHKDKAKGKQWVEAHEAYRVDYKKGKTTIQKIVPLCHYCHNFIHSGRLTAIFKQGKVSLEYVTAILEHGIEILSKNDLKMNAVTDELCKLVGVKHNLKVEKVAQSKVPWHKWYLMFEGEKHYSKFASKEEWKKHYEKETKKPKTAKI